MLLYKNLPFPPETQMIAISEKHLTLYNTNFYIYLFLKKTKTNFPPIPIFSGYFSLGLVKAKVPCRGDNYMFFTLYLNRWDGGSRLLAFKIILLIFYLPGGVNESLKSICIQPSKVLSKISTSRSQMILGGFISLMYTDEIIESLTKEPYSARSRQ